MHACIGEAGSEKLDDSKGKKGWGREGVKCADKCAWALTHMHEGERAGAEKEKMKRSLHISRITARAGRGRGEGGNVK